jgi:hypothetical protein
MEGQWGKAPLWHYFSACPYRYRMANGYGYGYGHAGRYYTAGFP